MNTPLQTVSQNKPMTFSNFMTSAMIKNKINEVVGGKNAQGFITSLVSAVSQNPQLAQCNQMSIFSAALTGEALNLAPSPQLGYYYLVPFKDKKKGMVAQFQIGYKGLIQLALRTGQYADLDVMEILDGEYLGRDSLTGKFKFNFIADEEERQGREVVGYMAYFELLNGFKKTMYWSKQKMEAHAKEYSQGYKKDLKDGTAYTFWSKDFNNMAFKTMLKQLLSKWAPLSTELQTAIVKDQAVIDKDDNLSYPDNADFDLMPEIDYNTIPLEGEEEKTESEPEDKLL